MKYIISVIILLVAISGGYRWFSQPTVVALEPATESTVLVGSGTIEAETIAITAELGGRIIELNVDEGDEVVTGQVLVELDKANLLAQHTHLESALATAKANLELVSAPPRPEDIATAEAQLAQAETARAGAKLTWQRVQGLVKNPHELEAKINQARAQVSETERELELAQVNLKRMEIEAEAASRDQSNHAALVKNETTQYRLQAARVGVEMTQVALAGAQQQLEHLRQIRDNPLPLIVQANAAEAIYRQAEAAVGAAEANLAAVKAGPTAEDIAMAQAQVREAEAALAAVDVQLAKQTLIAPRDGLISQRLVEPGELAAPGAVLLDLGDIETVDLTVYIPEIHIGQVKIGQPARVYVDAYEGQMFEGIVSFIAHEAEFTPKNVQTQEERVNLVFAVKITLENADHRLRPGMPADAEILLNAPVSAKAVPSPTALVQATPTATPARVEILPPPAPTPTPVEATPTPVPQAEVIAWAVNVRSGPGIEHPVIAGLRRGDTVPIIEVDLHNGWLQIQLPEGETTGWISGNPAYVTVR